jgi:L-alanine-DL-glutamate epimerase-like enolase superfamily enzyme
VRIVRVTARLLEAQAQTGVVFGLGAFERYSMVLVEVVTQDGLCGYGEAISRRGGEMTVAAVDRLLAPVLVGRDPRDIEGLWVEMVDRLRRWGHTTGVLLEAISGVDIPLWDLVGKAAGEPIWRLLVSRALSSWVKCGMLCHGTNWTAQAGVGVE